MAELDTTHARAEATRMRVTLAVESLINGLADEVDRLRAELEIRTAERDSAIVANHGVGRERDQARAERDEANAQAARLAAPSLAWAKRANALALVAELLAFVRWINEPFRADITDAQVVDAIQEQATAVLARTDPKRADL